MEKRIFLIHGWEGSPKKDWFPWARKVLEKKGYKVIVPEMPDSANPVKKKWIKTLQSEVGTLKNDDILVGHSLGSVAILRFLETIERKIKVNKVILVAPAIFLSVNAIENEDDKKVAKDWLGTPIKYEKIRSKAKSFTGILSLNDPWVRYDKSEENIEKNLKGKVVTEEKMGHFTAEEGVDKLPILLKLIQK